MDGYPHNCIGPDLKKVRRSQLPCFDAIDTWVQKDLIFRIDRRP